MSDGSILWGVIETLYSRDLAASCRWDAASCRCSGMITAGVFFGGIRGVAWGMERVSAFGGVEWWFS